MVTDTFKDVCRPNKQQCAVNKRLSNIKTSVRNAELQKQVASRRGVLNIFVPRAPVGVWRNWQTTSQNRCASG